MSRSFRVYRTSFYFHPHHPDALTPTRRMQHALHMKRLATHHHHHQLVPSLEYSRLVLRNVLSWPIPVPVAPYRAITDDLCVKASETARMDRSAGMWGTGREGCVLRTRGFRVACSLAWCVALGMGSGC
ncbi:hypothetical protein EJ04DRAFT_508285 [Polyplosphaeria fusca]|uniref:Uncharacterized protein n=1 Tax=Polyplosphaeria fusca TaxID=682080 RepID=A0A9P4RAD0_9PLEO|nr:hypothetical protein EJ04DRAFT_508285 [Polyplosphaeria fusca]